MNVLFWGTEFYSKVAGCILLIATSPLKALDAHQEQDRQKPLLSFCTKKSVVQQLGLIGCVILIMLNESDKSPPSIMLGLFEACDDVLP